MSNFTDVARLNELIGNPEGNLESIDWAALESQWALIEEEFAETRRAIQEHNVTELRDGVCDMLVTTYGLAHRAGIDADMDMAEVNRSNMSKFCRDAPELQATMAKYKGLGIHPTIRKHQGIIAVISTKDQTDIHGKFYPKGKLLKSIKFREPQFR